MSARYDFDSPSRVTLPERNEVLQEFEENLSEPSGEFFSELQCAMERREPAIGRQGVRALFFAYFLTAR